VLLITAQIRMVARIVARVIYKKAAIRGDGTMNRQELRERGHNVQAVLGLERGDAPETIPGIDDFIAEAGFGNVWDRPHLSREDRMICTLGVLGFLPQPAALERMVDAALGMGLQPRTILETFMQSGLYAGYVTTETAAAIAQKVFKARGLTVPEDPERNASNEELDRRGVELMQKLHGARATKGYGAGDNPITSKLYRNAIRYGYGELWFRPGLDHRQRMLVAIASFTGIPLESQLRKFSQSAVNIGMTQDEVIEAVIQTAPYTGFPRALNGLVILSEVFG
jgi:4-carboxymuconolactone decarboxylase